MQAPELQVSQWFNTREALTLDSFSGRVLVIEAFQMLCPGCVSHGIPLAQAVRRTFPEDSVAVIGLHTVFEHHAAMSPVSLEAFLFEYRIDFPVGVDQASQEDIPLTMQAYGMRGTPSLILIDGRGQIRAHHVGQISELALGAEIATLMAEGKLGETTTSEEPPNTIGCDEGSCRL